MQSVMVGDWFVFTTGQVKVLSDLSGFIFYWHRLHFILRKQEQQSGRGKDQRYHSVRSRTLTVCLHGKAFRGGAGLNTRDGPSSDWGSNLGPPSGSSCFTKIADRSWWKFHSNSGENKSTKNHTDECYILQDSLLTSLNCELKLIYVLNNKAL